MDDYMNQFVTDDEEVMQGIRIKREHTGYVTAIARELAKHLELSEHDVQLAEIMGLFHDVGRFRQYSIYKTFNDAQSEDHADLGLKVLAEEMPYMAELSAEDASRSDVDFLKNIYINAIDHGADRICVCDTVGILTPDTSYDLFSKLNDIKVPISCHCHNDFGLAVANTLSAIKGGASEIHTTINGIGERAGNTSFEECVVSIDRLLPDFSTGIKINQIYDVSKLVARLTGVYIQPNNIIKNSATYEPMTPELVGRTRKFIIGKHMGTHGLNSRLKEIGLEVNESQLKQICDDIKDLADMGKTVTDVDLQVIADNVLEINHEDRIKLDEITIVSGNKVMPTASVKLIVDGEEILNAGVGIGPVDAAINAIKSLGMFKDIELIEYHVDSITGGTDAFIDVIIKLQKEDNVVSARGTEADIINASVKAYIAGVNRLLRD